MIYFTPHNIIGALALQNRSFNTDPCKRKEEALLKTLIFEGGYVGGEVDDNLP